MMVTSTMSMDDALGQLRPLMTDDFIRAWRKVTLALGYRQVGKAVASLAAKSKPTTAQAPSKAYTLTEADQEYITSLESQLVEAETFFQDYPTLRTPPIRTVSRIRARKGLYGKGSTVGMVEQIAVEPVLASRLKERGIAVEHNKRSGLWWADVEDEAWGKDVNLEEMFGARMAQTGHTFDDVLGLYRKAVSYKADMLNVQGEIARVLVEGC
jgi:hypothetical protein